MAGYGGRVNVRARTVLFTLCSIISISVECSATQLARVVRKADNALHRINHYPVYSAVCFVVIHWIAIYQVDCVIQP